MAELLVRVVDKVGADIYQDAQLTKRGDVIAVCEDGAPWGTEDLANPEWRIVRVPGVAAERFMGLLTPELPIDPEQPSRTLQRRAFRLDLDHRDVDAAGLRAFFDNHGVTAVEADGGRPLAAIALVEVVTSRIDDAVTVKADALSDVRDAIDADPKVEVKATHEVKDLDPSKPSRFVVQTTKTVERDVVRYPVGALTKTQQAQLVDLAVTHVGDVLRSQCASVVGEGLLQAITVAKKPLADPSGKPSPRVIGG